MRRCCVYLLVLVANGIALAQTPGEPGAPGSKQRKVADFYVATDGSDEWSGQLPQPNQARTDGPFATLTRARDAVRTLKKETQKKEFLVLIRGGIYRLADTVVFSLEDSAPANGTITYAAYADESPVFTSAIPINRWHKPSDPSTSLPAAARASVWTADVPKGLSNVLTLYDGTKRMRRASSKSFAPVAYVDSAGPPDVLAFPTGAMKNWPDIRNGELRVIPNCDYEMCLLPLASVDEKTVSRKPWFRQRDQWGESSS